MHIMQDILLFMYIYVMRDTFTLSGYDDQVCSRGEYDLSEERVAGETNNKSV